ncbi:trypsin-like serine peptidase [Rhodococcus sp. O3]|uniref:trypsin-like serine peptidase n=1 Tax=Rhodococcus sp. O3 TaxID=3404919 RepID=UPI003B66C447
MTTVDVAWIDRIACSAGTFDWPEVGRIVQEYCRFLRGPDEQPPAEVMWMLAGLRRYRRFDDVIAVADAALGRGLDLPAVRRQYAQALVDRGMPAAALHLYSELADDPQTPASERVEARGGIGRCHKQLFLTTGDPARRAHHLRSSLDAYLTARDEAPARPWHAINAAALLARAHRDGLAVPGITDPAVLSRALAAQVLGAIETAAEPDAWAAATACEAEVALGDPAGADSWLDAFLADPGVDAFKIAALLRQLVEVWELTTAAQPGDTMLPLLRSALLHRDGGGVLVRDREVGTARLAHLEKVFGHDRYQSLTWYRHGLSRCRAVAQVCTPSEDGVGTGFVVVGRDLHPDLPERVLVTNGHVVPEGVAAADAVVVFHARDACTDRFRPVRCWWYAPSDGAGLDTSVLELDGWPGDVEPLPVAARLPALEPRPPRAYLIGHPRGLQQPQFSLQDNIVLDYDDTRVHYRSPTEGGSSGSPVFDDQWRLIGLHHAGGVDIPRLNHKGGTYSANEAITVGALRAALAHRAPRAREVA